MVEKGEAKLGRCGRLKGWHGRGGTAYWSSWTHGVKFGVKCAQSSTPGTHLLQCSRFSMEVNPLATAPHTRAS